MSVHGRDRKTSLVTHPEALLPVKAHPKALGLIKLIIVQLRLGMVVRRIAGPAARLVEHLPHHHIGIGRGLIVKHSQHLPVGSTVPLLLAELLQSAHLGRIKHRVKPVRIRSLLDQQPAVFLRRDNHLLHTILHTPD